MRNQTREFGVPALSELFGEAIDSKLTNPGLNLQAPSPMFVTHADSPGVLGRSTMEPTPTMRVMASVLFSQHLGASQLNRGSVFVLPSNCIRPNCHLLRPAELNDTLM